LQQNKVAKNCFIKRVKTNEHNWVFQTQDSAYRVLEKVFLAQLEELQPSKLKVSGSNPLEYGRV
tara:strand:+ start:7521 stop:7712 length:192 start_codon:yes stop_codon:yes gene_type:complete